jgi:hypothetical protein
MEEVKYRWIDDFTLEAWFGDTQLQLRPGVVLGSMTATKQDQQTWERLWTYPYRTYSSINDLIDLQRRETWQGWLEHLIIPLNATRFIVFFNVCKYYDSISFDPSDPQAPSIAYDVDMSRFTVRKLQLERGTYLIKHASTWHYGPRIFS